MADKIAFMHTKLLSKNMQKLNRLIPERVMLISSGNSCLNPWPGATDVLTKWLINQSSQGHNEMLFYNRLHRKQQEQKKDPFYLIFLSFSSSKMHLLEFHSSMWNADAEPPKCSNLTSKQTAPMMWKQCSVTLKNKKRGPPECEQVLVSINKAEVSRLSVFKRGSEWDRASVSNLECLGDANIFWGWRVSQTKTGNNEEKRSTEQTGWGVTQCTQDEHTLM